MLSLTTISAIGRTLVCVLVMVWIMISYAQGQDFPYLVPEAPEFDLRGNITRSAPASRTQDSRSKTDVRVQSPPTAPSFANPPKTQFGEDEYKARSERRGAPQTTYQREPPRGARPAAVGPPPHQGYPRARAPRPDQMRHPSGPTAVPGPPQAAVPQRPDCSEYPARLTHARTEAEMQAIARYYLGCLMQNGWDQSTASRHVSTLVDTWYRYTR